MLHANTPSLKLFWRKRWPQRRDYLELCHRLWHPLKRVRPKSKEDRIIQLNCWEVHTYANCEATSNIGEPQPPRSIKNASPFRQTMTDYISRVNGVETYDIKGKEALTGDWKELNKETYVCNICLQSDFKVYFCPQM